MTDPVLHEVAIHDLAFGGDGVGRLDGRVVFVPFTAVGDRVRIRIVQNKKSFLRGMAVEFLERAPAHEEPKCRYYNACGGCSYQHIRYEDEVKAKEKQVHDLLYRVGRLGEIEIRPIIPCPDPYNYRNRISVHHQAGRLGFKGRDGVTVVDIERCELASEPVNQALQELRRHHFSREHYAVRAPGVLQDAFQQANGTMVEILVGHVSRAVDPGAEALLEGYAGAGLFTLPLAKRVPAVSAIEMNPRAVEHGRKLSPPSIAWFSGPCEEHLHAAREHLGGAATVCLLDPPRDGLSSTAKRALLGMEFMQMVYLSCNPATLSRDLHDFAPRWHVEWVQPIDLFPRTAHVECLVSLRPASKEGAAA
jgi:tRNA/tmRNA/rRNA uracil-C5-methylase (TrmA/RlmC/RlmD family)